MSTKIKNCRNKSVVSVDSRLYSPYYDRPLFALFDDSIMCYYGLCSYESYKAWVESTEVFINGKLKSHYNLVVKKSKHFYGTGLLPVPLQSKLKKISDFIDKWNGIDWLGSEVGKDPYVNVWAVVIPITYYEHWSSKVRGVVQYFDEAACLLDDLNVILEDEINAPDSATEPPRFSIDPGEPPDGDSWLGGSGGESEKSSKKARNVAIGAVAIAAGSYFAYRVLTE